MCACVHVCVQLNEELLQVLNADELPNGFSVTSAPVILYLNSPRCDITNTELAISDDKQLKRVSECSTYFLSCSSLAAADVI